MIDITENLKNQLYSEYMPKCDVEIVVGYTEGDVELKLATFDTSNITDVTLKQTIDPVGRELPSTTLTWMEYAEFDESGRLAKQNRQRNAQEKMHVDLAYIYTRQLDGDTWEFMRDTMSSWNDVKTSFSSWDTFRKAESGERVVQRRLFLAGKPTCDGTKWQWTARDLLSFCSYEKPAYAGFTDSLLKLYPVSDDPRKDMPLKMRAKNYVQRNELAIYLLDAGKSASRNSSSFNAAIAETEASLATLSDDPADVIGKAVIVSGACNSALKDVYSSVNYWLKPCGSAGGFGFEQLLKATEYGWDIPTRQIMLAHMSELPKEELQDALEEYTFEASSVSVDNANAKSFLNGTPSEYTQKWREVVGGDIPGDAGTIMEYGTEQWNFTFGDTMIPAQDPYVDSLILRYIPDNVSGSDDVTEVVTETGVSVTFTRYHNIIEESGEPYIGTLAVTAVPVKNVKTSYSLKPESKTRTSEVSDGKFSETNELNIYTDKDAFAKTRCMLLSSYFGGSSAFTVETFGDVSIEAGDLVSIETNEASSEGDNNIIVDGIVVSNEIKYAGATTQTLIIHEIKRR